MQKIKSAHFFLPLAFAVSGATVGRILFMKYGGCIDASTVFADNNFVVQFLSDFFITALPFALIIFLSVTVYAIPVALAALAFEAMQDSYYVFSVYAFSVSSDNAARLPCLLFAATKIFFTYCFFIVAVMTLSYRSVACKQTNSAKPAFTGNGLRYMISAMQVGGTMCICAIFSQLILFYS